MLFGNVRGFWNSSAGINNATPSTISMAKFDSRCKDTTKQEQCVSVIVAVRLAGVFQ